MKVNFYLKDKEFREEIPLYVTGAYTGKKVRIYTNKSVNPKQWNDKKQKARQSNTAYAIFNKSLQNIEKREQR